MKIRVTTQLKKFLLEYKGKNGLRNIGSALEHYFVQSGDIESREKIALRIKKEIEKQEKKEAAKKMSDEKKKNVSDKKPVASEKKEIEKQEKPTGDK